MSPRTPFPATNSTPTNPTPESAGGASPMDSAEDVFLSPRVVDRRAFGELATELRRLVERAAGERAALGAAVDQADASTRALRETEAAQQGNLELTARALKRLDERTAKAEQILDQASNANQFIDKFQTQADRIIAERIEALEARLESAQAGAAARVEALEQRLARATRDMEQRIEAVRRDAEGVVGPTLTSLTQTVAHAGMLLGRSPTDAPDGPVAKDSLQDLVRRAEGIRESADGAVRQLETIQTRAAGSRATFASLLEELSSLINRVDAQRTALVKDNEKLCRDCAETQTTLEQRLGETRRQAESTLAEIKPRAEAATTEAAAALEELRELVRRATDAHNTTSLVLRLADRSNGQMNAALAALEPWRKSLIDADPSDIPPPIRAIVEAVRREFTTDLSGIAQALRIAATNAERAAEKAAEAGRSPVVVRSIEAGSHAAD